MYIHYTVGSVSDSKKCFWAGLSFLFKKGCAPFFAFLLLRKLRHLPLGEVQWAYECLWTNWYPPTHSLTHCTMAKVPSIVAKPNIQWQNDVSVANPNILWWNQTRDNKIQVNGNDSSSVRRQRLATSSWTANTYWLIKTDALQVLIWWPPVLLLWLLHH